MQAIATNNVEVQYLSAGTVVAVKCRHEDGSVCFVDFTVTMSFNEMAVPQYRVAANDHGVSYLRHEYIWRVR